MVSFAQTKISTLFNNSSPLRHPSGIFESTTYVNNVCCSVSAARMRIRCLRFDLKINNVSAYIRYLHMWYSPKWHQGDVEEMNCWIKSLFLFSLHTKSILVASWNYGWTTDVTDYVSGPWLGKDPCCLWEGQRALRIHKKYLNLCSEDERNVSNSWIFWVNYPFNINWNIYVEDARKC